MRASAAPSLMKFDPVAIKRFVREVIGCNCPDEVFNHIELRSRNATKDSPADYEINIGGRLLIRVTSEQAIGAQGLAGFLQQGKATRDARGFNRFRLVVLTDKPKELEPTLSQQFRNLSFNDEKIHLHVIAQNDFPDLSAGSK